MPACKTVATTLALGLLAAGCGSREHRTVPTKSQYVKQANAICKVGNDTLTTSAARTFTGPRPTRAQVQRFATVSAYPALEREIKALRALTPPQGDQATVEAIYDAVQRGLDETKRDPYKFAVPGSQSPFNEANRRANAYGLTVCGAS